MKTPQAIKKTTWGGLHPVLPQSESESSETNRSLFGTHHQQVFIFFQMIFPPHFYK
jgi:hypothetical protein